MTTIAFDGKTLSSERAVRSGNYSPHNNFKKLNVLSNGMVCVMCGALGAQRKVLNILSSIPKASTNIDYVAGNFNKSNLSGVALLLVVNSKLFHLYIDEEVNTGEVFVTHLSSPIAFGSGTDFAAGVLALGFTSDYAVLAATLCDTGSGGKIDTYNIETDELYVTDPRDMAHPVNFSEMSSDFFQTFNPMRLDL